MVTRTVSSVAELQSAFAAARGGDNILLENGYYGWVTLSGGNFPSDVIIAPAAGHTPTIKHISISSSQNVALRDLAIELGADPSGGQLMAAEIKSSIGVTLLRCSLVGDVNVDTSKWDTAPSGLRVCDNSTGVKIEECTFLFFSTAILVDFASDIYVRDLCVRDCHDDLSFFQCSGRLSLNDCHH